MTTTVIRNRCIRCKAPITAPADITPRVTVMLQSRELRGFYCDPCEEQVQHMHGCKTTVHVERWPT